jgi:hypothetical protein
MHRGGLIAMAMLVVLAMAGVASATTVNPSSRDYGDQAVGTASAATTFTLTTSPAFCNDPPDCLTYSSYSTDTSALGGGPGTTNTSGDFLIRNDTCANALMGPPVLAATGSCQFEVSFVPTSGGAKSKTLTFPETSGSNASLTLTGNGLAPGSTPTPGATQPTGEQAVAIKRCKRKFPKGSSKRRKCLRRARQLPG